MIICQCQVVGDRAIAEAVEAGARTVAQVCRATGAGQGCGSCVFSLKRLLGDDGRLCDDRLLCDDGRSRSKPQPEVDVAAC